MAGYPRARYCATSSSSHLLFLGTPATGIQSFGYIHYGSKRLHKNREKMVDFFPIHSLNSSRKKHPCRPSFLWIQCTGLEKSLSVVVIGSGGREHALCDAISQSPYCKQLFALPGNAGMRSCAQVVEHIQSTDFEDIARFCREKEIDFAVIGPETPLVHGLVDRLGHESIVAFGPNEKAAILEGSKVWMKHFLKQWNIPTAKFECFRDSSLAKKYLKEQSFPVVIKANGLAAGKGVIIAEDLQTAEEAIDSMLEKAVFGSAGSEVVIEEYLQGEEMSFFALVDGIHVIPFGSAQDHKRALDNDQGPNTGGMGAYSPSPLCTEELQEQIMKDIIVPTARGMVQEGRPYRGILYCGLILTKNGPKVLEYNVRFGDPECQVLCPRLESDLLHVLYQVAVGETHKLNIEWKRNVWSLVVIMASKGYPGSYQKGTIIRHLEEAGRTDGVKIYHSGTSICPTTGEWIATGGRVLGITGIGNTIREAKARAYEATEKIDWPQGFYRKDIGWRCLAALESKKS
eukprot:jgi/Galph1/4162/GphlegSOOS_G2802.1